jgi:predicted Zn finger-like uncharacterized protein
MILTCPECRTRFLVDPAKIPPGGRAVRCGRCGHSWHQEASATAPVPAQPMNFSAEMRPIPPGSNLPALTAQRPRRGAAGWLLLLLLVALLVVGAVAGRDRIVKAWPPAARLYTQLGMPVEAPGSGLELRNITYSRETDGDATVLVVAGQVANVSKEPKDVPLLQGMLHDAHDKEVQQWNFPAKDNKLAPGAVTSFETRLRSPPADATGLVIGFAGS